MLSNFLSLHNHTGLEKKRGLTKASSALQTDMKSLNPSWKSPETCTHCKWLQKPLTGPYEQKYFIHYIHVYKLMYLPKSRLKNVLGGAIVLFWSRCIGERKHVHRAFSQVLCNFRRTLMEWNLKPEKVCEQTSQCLLFRTTGMQGRTKTYPGYTCMKLSVYYSPVLP